MDQETKRQLKQNDRFVTTGENSLAWARQNQTSTLTVGAAVLVAILILVGAVTWYQHRAAAANQALGAAMQTYNTPLVSATRPLAPGEKSFPDAKSRAVQANAEFLAVASQYGAEPDGKIARYFAGLTYVEAGENTQAEDTLKTVAGFWNGDLSALGKLGLAQLYRSEGHDDQAATLYKQLAAGNASTVSPGVAQIELAGMYAADGKTAEARTIYAQLKDKDKDVKTGKEGPVGALAAEKLNPAPAPAAGVPQL